MRVVAMVQDKAPSQAASRNLLRTLAFAFGTFGIADPCVSGEPFMHLVAERAMSSAEEYRRGSEGGEVNVCACGDCAPCLRATDHQGARLLGLHGA